MDTKICTHCKEEKPLERFSWRNKAKGIKNSWCKDCYKTYDDRLWNRDKSKKKLRAKERHHRLRKTLFETLLNSKCEICGETDPFVLEFDHIDPAQKKAAVSVLVGRRHSWESVQKEINKCRVLCANCHRRETAKEQNWYKDVRIELGV